MRESQLHAKVHTAAGGACLLQPLSFVDDLNLRSGMHTLHVGTVHAAACFLSAHSCLSAAVITDPGSSLLLRDWQ